MSANEVTRNAVPGTRAYTALLLMAMLSTLVNAQEHPEPDVVATDGLTQPPTLEERIQEEREVADVAATEAVSDEDLDVTGIDAPLDEPSEPPTHASSEAPPELVAMASREPERFIGKMLVLDDGVNSEEVGPVLDLRKRISDQEPHVIVDATEYFNTPTQYAVAVRDLDRIDGDRLVTPEVEGMHLRGLDYYPEDFTDITGTAPEDVLAENLDTDGDGVDDPDQETGVIPIRRF